MSNELQSRACSYKGSLCTTSTVHVNREAVHLEIAKLLVQLGLHRPKETFWGHLLGFIQWATEAPIDNPHCDRDMLKAMWNEAKTNVALHCDAPTDYPVMPAMLMETHAHIYLRAYVGNEQPTLPPSTKDMHSLDVLKAIGCRTTTATVYQDAYVVLQRHHYSSRNDVGARKAVPATPPW